MHGDEIRSDAYACSNAVDITSRWRDDRKSASVVDRSPVDRSNISDKLALISPDTSAGLLNRFVQHTVSAVLCGLSRNNTYLHYLHYHKVHCHLSMTARTPRRPSFF